MTHVSHSMTMSNISVATGPVTNTFDVGLFGTKGTIICYNGLGHMTKNMVAMPVGSKTVLNILF